MPEGEAIADPAVEPYLSKYAGQPLTTGAQAEAYANHYIAVHLAEASGAAGPTPAQAPASPANPDDAELAGLVASSFKGETLRGLLLNAYAFGTMGQIALYAAIASFIGAGLLLLMSVLGLVHARRTDPVEELGGHQPALRCRCPSGSRSEQMIVRTGRRPQAVRSCFMSRPLRTPR